MKVYHANDDVFSAATVRSAMRAAMRFAGEKLAKGETNLALDFQRKAEEFGAQARRIEARLRAEASAAAREFEEAGVPETLVRENSPSTYMHEPPVFDRAYVGGLNDAAGRLREQSYDAGGLIRDDDIESRGC
jgi:hypothetical protein